MKNESPPSDELRDRAPSVGSPEESVELKILPPADRDAQIALLESPWIAEEGPISVRFFRHQGKAPALLPRGLAFDRRVTVIWDEDAVQVVASREPEGDVLAVASPVLLEERFADVPPLHRIDYFRSGVWLASRYLPESEADHA